VTPALPEEADDVSALVKSLMRDYSKSEYEAFLSELARLIWAGDIECYLLKPTIKTEGTTLTLSGGVSLRVSDSKFVPRASSEEKLRLATDALEFARDRIFLCELPCDCCDNGCQEAPCTCMDYSISDEMRAVGERAREALARIRERNPASP
jgi:hypothetical protein